MLGYSGLHSGVPFQLEVGMFPVSSPMHQESKRPRQLCQGLAWNRHLGATLDLLGHWRPKCKDLTLGEYCDAAMQVQRVMCAS